MSLSRKDERSLLSHDEWVVVERTHHPEIDALSLPELRDLRHDVRAMRNKERGLAHEKKRIARGKSDPRGGSFPGTYDRPKRRKQVFAGALQRVNSAVERANSAEARAALVESQQRALAMKRTARPHHRPANSRTANAGVAAVENKKRRTATHGAKVGSVSQQGKKAQARRDG